MKIELLSVILLVTSFTLSAQNPNQTLIKATAALDEARPSKVQLILAELPEERWELDHHELKLATLFQQEKFKEVLTYGEALQEKFDLSSDSELYLIHASIAVGKINNAMRKIEELESLLQPDEYQIVRGKIWLHAADFVKAAMHFESAIALNPESSLAWTCNALVLEHEQRYDKAMEAFELAQKLNPHEILAYHGSARIWSLQKKTTPAIKEYAEGLKHNPESISLMMNGTKLSLDDGQYSLARYFSNQALKLNNRLGEAHANLGMSYFLEQDYDQALPHFMRATQNRNDGGDHYYLGLAAIRTRNMDQAHRHLEMALSLGFERDDLPQLVEHCRSILASFDTDQSNRPY